MGERVVGWSVRGVGTSVGVPGANLRGTRVGGDCKCHCERGSHSFTRVTQSRVRLADSKFSPLQIGTSNVGWGKRS